MDESNRCRRCGTELLDQAPADALCPACLLTLGLSGAVPAYTEPGASDLQAGDAAPPRRRSLRRLAVVLALLAVLMALFALGRTTRQTENRVVRFSIHLPEEAEFSREDGGTQAALSPDGRRLAFTATAPGGAHMLWSRELSSLANEALPGTEGASMPFWSPDSQHIGFFAQGKLKTTAARGGSVQTLCDAPRPRGAAWGSEGTILFAPNSYGGLYRVPSAGGTPRQATQVDRAKGATAHRWPSFLPGERHFLYSSLGVQPEKTSIVVEAVGRPQSKVVLEGVAAASYAGGYLLYVRSNALIAQPFDAVRLQFAGDPRPVPFVGRIESGAQRFPAFAAADDVLAYRGAGIYQTQLAWCDRTGRVLSTTGEPGEFGRFSLSPDRTTALSRIDPETGVSSLWLLDLARGTNMRVTFDRRSATAPVWSPDGNWIAFSVQDGNAASLHKMRANGSGDDQTLVSSADWNTVDCWSPDGRFIVYTARDREGKSALWLLPMTGDSKPQPLLRTPFQVGQAQLSPDGRWLAYVSDESGRDEVYVQAFPLQDGGKWQISANGGTHPSWSGRADELLFVSPERKLMAVRVQPRAAELRPGVPIPLFRMTGGRFYAVSPGGEHILVQTRPGERVPAAIQMVLNWTDELQK